MDIVQRPMIFYYRLKGHDFKRIPLKLVADYGRNVPQKIP
jgi:hypothetical protein